MKIKFLALLKSKNAHVGVSDKAFDRVASFYEKNGLIKEESTDEELTTLAEGAETLLVGMKAESDSKLEDFKKKNNPPQVKPKTEEKPTEIPKTEDEVPAWAKALIESNNSLKSEIAGIKTTNIIRSRKQQLEGRMEGISEGLKNKAVKDFERMQFESDEAFESYLEETAADYTELNKQFSQEGLGQAGKTVVGGSSSDKTKVEQDIKSWAASKSPSTN